VELRPLHPTDAQAMLDLRVRNRRHFLSGEPIRGDRFFTLEGQEDELAALAVERAAGTREQFGIYVDGELGGFIALGQVFRGAFQNAMLGYAVDRRHNGRGVATEAVAAAVDYAWSIGLHRVQANVRTDNPASMRVLAKNRFRHEGTALRYLRIGGEWADHHMFARTVEEGR
jgi:ribosomal-protein-alanine N-acetyltransferase